MLGWTHLQQLYAYTLLLTAYLRAPSRSQKSLPSINRRVSTAVKTQDLSDGETVGSAQPRRPCYYVARNISISLSRNSVAHARCHAATTSHLTDQWPCLFTRQVRSAIPISYNIPPSNEPNHPRRRRKLLLPLFLHSPQLHHLASSEIMQVGPNRHPASMMIPERISLVSNAHLSLLARDGTRQRRSSWEWFAGAEVFCQAPSAKSHDNAGTSEVVGRGVSVTALVMIAWCGRWVGMCAMLLAYPPRTAWMESMT